MESVPETDAVPHVLAEDDGDESVEPDGLSVPLLQLDSEGLTSVGETEGGCEQRQRSRLWWGHAASSHNTTATLTVP